MGAAGTPDEPAVEHLSLSNGAADVDGDGSPTLGGEEDEDADEGEDESVAMNPSEKKKQKKKKKGGPTTSAQAMALQSEPPRTPLSTFFKSTAYPVGEIQEYQNDNAWRTTSEEKRHLEKVAMEHAPDSVFNYNSIRRAAEVHRQVRAYARKTIKPGMSMTEIAELIEDGTRALVEENGMQAGIAFPTGLSRNNCAAHYSPNAGDTIVLKHEDVLKVDFGVHVNGRIVDSAFTLTWEPTYDKLLAAVKDACNSAIREAGIDVRTGDLGAVIQEVMGSYEVEVNGKMLPVNPIRNITGHSIGLYKIHGGKSIPSVRKRSNDERIEEGDYFAIEPFGSTGSGVVRNEGVCSHYAVVPKEEAPVEVQLNSSASKRLLNTINKQFGTLPFCRRYLDRVGETAYLRSLNELVRFGLVRDYPPLCDIEGSMTAQFAR